MSRIFDAVVELNNDNPGSSVAKDFMNNEISIDETNDDIELYKTNTS